MNNFNNNNSLNQVKEFEDAFDACVGLLANSNCQQSSETEELKLSIEQCVQKFLDQARQLETFFIQKRFQFISQRPEQILIEDINEIKAEIARKDHLIERFNEKLDHWQNILSDNSLPNNQQSMSINQNANMQMINLQNSQNQQISSHLTMNIRQRSPIQQKIIPNNIQTVHSGMRPNMMGPPPQHHNYQQQYPMQNQQMMNIQNQPQPAILPDSPMSSSMINQMHSLPASYNSNNNQQPQQQSHLAFLEKATSNIGLPDTRR